MASTVSFSDREMDLQMGLVARWINEKATFPVPRVHFKMNEDLGAHESYPQQKFQL